MQEIERKPELAFWVEHVEAYEREAKSWESKSKKIIKRYRDQRTDEVRAAQFNILWSNVQTLHPALYSGTPTPNVDRRYDDDEEVNTTVAQILERATAHYVKTNDFDDCMNQAVLDRLLPGRGVTWVRYTPVFGEAQQVTDDAPSGEELYSEDVALDYVHWQDFGHSVSRTWQENRAVWRKVYLSRKEGLKRFGDKFKDAPLDAKTLGKRNDERTENNTKSTIYELWDRVTKKAYWFHMDMEDFLDVQEDPLKLDGFYPCPKPLFATLANDSLIPTQDFALYQDQARELDTMTARIDSISKALKVVGVYDASAEAISRMLSENVDNKLIPVEQWAIFAEKGGIKGIVDFMPIDMVSNVLLSLYESRDKIKQDIYEITGISDIVRGSTNANETATAQQIKGQYATLRLDNMQAEVARFARDNVKLIAEVIAEHFSLDTLKKISGVRLLTEQEKAMAMQLKQAQEQFAQLPPEQQQMMQPPAPVPEKATKLMDKPTWEEIEAVLRENGARCFRIDIQTDSTIKADQEADKASRIEFLTAAGSFIQQAATIPVPELQPLLMEMLRFGVGGFKAAREIESEFKSTLEVIKTKAEQPPAPQADPLAIEKEKLALQDATEQKKLQSNETVEMAKIASNEKIEAMKSNADVHKHRMTTKATVDPNVAMMDSDLNEGQSPIMMLAQMMQQNAKQTNEALLALGVAQDQNTKLLISAMTKPKKVDVLRDSSGKMLSAEVH